MVLKEEGEMRSQVSVEILVSMLLSLLIVVSALGALHQARQLFSETGSALASSAGNAIAYASSFGNT